MAVRLRLPKLPRAAYWATGALIAFAGAVAARVLAEHAPGYRVIVWLVGAAVVFLGLGILSLGTRSRLDRPAGPDSDTRVR